MKKINNWLILLNVITLLGAVYLYILSTQQAVEISKINLKLNEIDNIRNELKTLESNEVFQRVAHTIEGAYVTDDFIVERVNFYTDENNKKLFSVSIELSPQPRMALLNKGTGRFDITDRELRSKLAPFVPEIKKYYNTFAHRIEWSSHVEAKITINNYDVAKYINNKLLLSGDE